MRVGSVAVASPPPARSSPGAFERHYVDFYPAGGVCFRLGEIIRRQEICVQRVGNCAGPTRVKRLPVPLRVKRGMKMIEQRHLRITPRMS